MVISKGFSMLTQINIIGTSNMFIHRDAFGHRIFGKSRTDIRVCHRIKNPWLKVGQWHPNITKFDRKQTKIVLMTSNRTLKDIAEPVVTRNEGLAVSVRQLLIFEHLEALILTNFCSIKCKKQKSPTFCRCMPI